MSVEKVNSSTCPQTDGLVEQFNHTLTDMLAKSVLPELCKWDERLPYVLFSYRASLESLTGESPSSSYMAGIMTACTDGPLTTS